MKKIFFTFLLISTNLFSQTPSVFNLQGILRSPTGQAVADGEYSFTFKIYDRAKSGDELAGWVETQKIEVKNGIYNALVGSVRPFTGLAFDKTYFVGITVAGGDELSPRIQLTASPYALSLQGVGNKVPNDGAMSFSSNVYHQSNGINRIKFNNDGSNEINGITAINATNGGPLQLVGTNSSIIEFFPSGKTAGRKSYFGHTSGARNDITITNEVTNGNINLFTESGSGNVITNSNLNVGGSLNVTKAEGSNVMVRVGYVNVADINGGHIAVTGLDGNKHKRYKVYYHIYMYAAADDNLHIRFNDDMTNGAYKFEGWAKWHGGDATYRHSGQYSGAFIPIYNGWSQAGWFDGEFTVNAEAGQLRTVYGSANFINGTNPAFGHWSGSWTNTSANITLISFSTNRRFGKGTISVYAIP